MAYGLGKLKGSSHTYSSIWLNCKTTQLQCMSLPQLWFWIFPELSEPFFKWYWIWWSTWNINTAAYSPRQTLLNSETYFQLSAYIYWKDSLCMTSYVCVVCTQVENIYSLCLTDLNMYCMYFHIKNEQKGVRREYGWNEWRRWSLWKLTSCWMYSGPFPLVKCFIFVMKDIKYVYGVKMTCAQDINRK